MEFGRTSKRKLDTVNFSLPPQREENKKILTGLEHTKPKVFIGGSKWGKHEWIGKIFPPKVSDKYFLENYARHFNSIELNATHYKLISSKTINKWIEKTAGIDFLYCPKLYQGITHKGTLYDKDEVLREFLAGVSSFKKQLGPILIQISESLGPKRKAELFSFLESLPRTLGFFVEVRHAEWLTDVNEQNELFSFCAKYNIGVVITDTALRRDCAHMRLAIPKVFIRYVGEGLHNTDYNRIDEWVKQLKIWIENGLEEVYFFMHLEEEQYLPELTTYMIENLNDTCGLNLKKPTFIKKNNILF